MLDEPPPCKQHKVNKEEEDKETTKEIKITTVKGGEPPLVVQPNIHTEMDLVDMLTTVVMGSEP